MGATGMTQVKLQRELANHLERLGVLPKNAAWHSLAGGRTNSLWSIAFSHQRLVCKLFRKNGHNPLFPNEIEDEAKALILLSGSGLAPQFIARVETVHGPCLLYQYVEGRVWRQAVTPVAGLLAALHTRPERPDVRKLASGSDALVAQGRAILDLCCGDEAKQMRMCQPCGDIGPVKSPVLVHGDVVPNNVLITDQGPMLIDWQCPAIADPCEDIATFLSPAMQALYGSAPLPMAEVDEFLQAYGTAEITDRYRQLAPFFHWRMAAYCLWKTQNGAPDYQAAIGLELAAL